MVSWHKFPGWWADCSCGRVLRFTLFHVSSKFRTCNLRFCFFFSQKVWLSDAKSLFLAGIGQQLDSLLNLICGCFTLLDVVVGWYCEMYLDKKWNESTDLVQLAGKGKHSNVLQAGKGYMSCEHFLLSALLRKVNDWLRPPGSKEDQPFEAEAWCVWCHETTPWRQLFGKTYILNPPRWLSMVSALDIHSIRNSWMPQPQYSYCQASRLAGGLMSKKSLEKAAWIHRTSFCLSHDNLTITSRCRFGFIQLKLVKAAGPELGKIFNFFEKSTSLDSFDRTEALPLCAASLWRCHGGTGYALERGKAAMAGNTWKATLPGRCYLSFWVETLMQMKAHPGIQVEKTLDSMMYLMCLSSTCQFS